MLFATHIGASTSNEDCAQSIPAFCKGWDAIFKTSRDSISATMESFVFGITVRVFNLIKFNVVWFDIKGYGGGGLSIRGVGAPVATFYGLK